MESPYNRPVAANLIDRALELYDENRANYPELCGFSREMYVYTSLKRAGFLTEKAMVPAEDEPKVTESPGLCCGRKSKWDPCR